MVAQTCDRIAVMRHGQIVEQAEKRTLLSAPQHPYTQALIASHPSLSHTGSEPESHPHDRSPVFQIDALEVDFPVGSGFLTKKRVFRALKGISLNIWPGETVGIVGESGSGKSLLCRTAIGLFPSKLLHVTAGRVTLDGHEILGTPMQGIRGRRIGMIFQNPTAIWTR